MSETQRSQYLTRDSILKLLSDDEVARVSTAEAGPPLKRGDEYVDLERLGDGVQSASGAAKPGGESAAVGHWLPRKSVEAPTWRRILKALSEAPSVLK